MNKWQTALLFLLPAHDYILLPISSAVAPQASQRRDQDPSNSHPSAAWTQAGLYTKPGVGESNQTLLEILRPATQDLIIYFKNTASYKDEQEENSEHMCIHHPVPTVVNILPNMFDAYVLLS